MGDTLHQGQATERNVDSASARVGFDDLGGTTSGFMQVLFPAIGGWNLFYTPKEGDQVVTERLPNGKEEGYIFGKVYTANKMPQGGAPDIFLMVSEDGKNVIKLDAAKGTLEIISDQGTSLKCKSLDIEVSETANINTKNANIKASENINVEAKEAKIKTTGDTTVEASGDVKVKGVNVNVEATATATVKSAKVTITGGSLITKGSVAPTGSGAYCGLPYCVCNGAPQAGSTVTGT